MEDVPIPRNHGREAAGRRERGSRSAMRTPDPTIFATRLFSHSTSTNPARSHSGRTVTTTKKLLKVMTMQSHRCCLVSLPFLLTLRITKCEPPRPIRRNPAWIPDLFKTTSQYQVRHSYSHVIVHVYTCFTTMLITHFLLLRSPTRAPHIPFPPSRVFT